jgi:hypothetical protein
MAQSVDSFMELLQQGMSRMSLSHHQQHLSKGQRIREKKIEGVNITLSTMSNREIWTYIFSYCKLELKPSITQCKAFWKESGFLVNIYDFVDYVKRHNANGQQQTVIQPGPHFNDLKAFKKYSKRKLFPKERAKSEHVRMLLVVLGRF